jgi:alanine dehydrogenase
MMSEGGMLDIATKLMPKEEKLAVFSKKSSMKIGVLAETNDDECRVCLTPESVELLVESGNEVLVQSGAGVKAGYSDMNYSENGATITLAYQEIMQADIILKVSALNKKERMLLHKNQLVISSLQLLLQNRDYFSFFIDHKATAMAFEKIKDQTGAFPLIRSMSEIVGTAGIQIAAHYLSHPDFGNGTLLGGIPGLSPTRVVIIGAGSVGEFAARTALGMGAHVKVFDNSIYKLRRMQNNLRQNIFTSTLQPQVLQKAIKEADVVIGALRVKDGRPVYQVPSYMIESMKEGSVIVDVSIDQGGIFETSRSTTHKEPVYQKFGVTHYCVPNIASRVAFTASNALSNYFAPLLLEIGENGGFVNYLKKDEGFRNGVYIFNGIVTDFQIGNTFGYNYRDIELLLAVLH